MQLIIIIDQEVNTLREIEEELKGERFRIIVTNNCKKGFEYSRSAPPSVLIMGFNLNYMEPFETLVALRKESITRNIPILGVLSEEIPSYTEHLMNSGMNAYITKPIRKRKLVTKIAELLSHSDIQKTNTTLNSKNHASISLNTDDRVMLEFRSGLKNYVLPEIRNVVSHDFIKSVLHKHVCIDIRLLPEMTSEELIIFKKILGAFGQKKVSIITGAHMGSLIRNTDISDVSNLFLSLNDYDIFLENPELDE